MHFTNLFLTFFHFSILLLGGNVIGGVDGSTGHGHQKQKLYSKLFVFGDSYADTGNSRKLVAGSWKEPYGVTFPGKPSGRYSNGRVFTDYIAKHLGVKSPVAYRWMKYAGKSIRHGINFAYGGTGVFDTLITDPNMSTQIDFFNKLIDDSTFTKHDLQSSLVLVTLSGNDYGAYLAKGGSNQMPRGGGSSSSRPGKKRVRHPGLTIEPDDSPMPSYRQQTLPPTHDLSIVASRTVTDSQGGQSTSGSGGDGFLHPSRMTSSRRSAPVSVEPAGSDDGSDTESDAGGDDVSAARVRGSGCPLEPLAPGEKLRCSIVQGKLEGKGVSHFFLKQIKCQTISFWPYYSKVLKSVKEGIWNSFLARYYIVGGTDVQAKILFESDSHKKWKNFLTKQKKKCLASVNNDYARLREAPRLRWCTQEDSWEEYLEHWLSEDQKKIAEQASRNRLCSAGRPEGQISVHPYGSKGLKTRMWEQKEKTGVWPSPLEIVMGMQKKKDKATQEETGDVYDSCLVSAIEAYKGLFAEKYGAERDPMSCPIVEDLWLSVDEVRRGLTKGRVLGLGTSGDAAHLLVKDPVEAAEPAVANADVVEELRRGWEEEKEKNRILSEKLLVVEATNAMLVQKVTAVEDKMNALTDMWTRIYGGQGGPSNVPAGSHPALGRSLPSVGSTQASGGGGFMAQLAEMGTLPVPQFTVQSSQGQPAAQTSERSPVVALPIQDTHQDSTQS